MRKDRENHGKSKTREYRIWQNMRNRCYYLNSSEYNSHGGRGIIVCDRWKNSFLNFLEDMGLSNGLSIDRINNDGNYEPSNCRWATPAQQSLNTRRNHLLTYKGVTKTIKEWNIEKGFGRGTIPTRIKYGWSIEKIIETPSRVKSKTNINY